MQSISASGRGWINLEPEVPDDADVPGPGLFSFMSARGPAVPLATWLPARRTRRGRPRPATVGIQHPSGTRAMARLTERGLDRPADWRVTQDHPKRGLVVEARGPAPTEAEMLEWVLRAAELLSVLAPTGWWVASVYLSGP
jgi:hypothetical protein